MRQKRLMLLGGIRYLIPAINVAHKHGCHVITVDYLPDNIAHSYSDEYKNVSILDREAVLRLAKDHSIDGILSYAVDPGVVTAAYVAEQMGLPFSCSYATACVLQDKALFRGFLIENGFNSPHAKGYSRIEDVFKDIDYFTWPVIVKPVDSAGSKGVTRVDFPEDLKPAVKRALDESHNGFFIVEDYLEKDGLSSGAESFFVDGELKYNAFYDQLFDLNATNPYTPSAECWPSNQRMEYQEDVKFQLQRLGSLLSFRTGIFNVEWRVCRDGKVYLMEVSPRAGGNRLAEILNHATDVDIIEAEVSKAINESIPIIHEPNYNGHYCILVLHANRSGRFVDVKIGNSLKGDLIEKEIRVEKGSLVEPFSGANNAIGTLFLRFNSRQEMDYALSHQSDWLSIILEEWNQ